MSLAVSGAAAAYAASQLQPDGSYAAALTALPPNLDTLPDDQFLDVIGAWIETQAGYDNSPHPTPFTLRFQGRKVVDDAAPRYGTVIPIANRTWFLKAVPDPSNVTGLSTNYAAVSKEPISPGERKRFVFNLEDKLEGAGLDTITAIGLSYAASALGITIAGGADRLLIDRQAKLAQIILCCDAASSSLASLTGVGRPSAISCVARDDTGQLLAGTGAVMTRNT